MDVVIGIDTGTTATKGVAAGIDGEVRAVTSVHYPLSVPGPGRAELDAGHLRDAAVEALTGIAAQCRENGDRVVAVSLSAFLHALVPMDADSKPLGAVVTWADGRAAEQTERLITAGTAARLHSRTGTPVHPMSPLAKLAWWNENDPETLRGVPRWGGVKELVLGVLSDSPYVTDLSVASGTGLYDVHARRWDPEAMQIAGVRPDQLAEVVPTVERLRLDPGVAAAAGLPADVPLIAGAADGPLANLGVGATPAGVAAVSLGTSGALRTIVDAPVADAAGKLFCYALTEDRWTIGGAVNNAGSVIRWAGQSFAPELGGSGEEADKRDAALLAEAASVPAGSNGLLCLPYLLGERAPWWRSGLRGAYIGLRREHGRPHLVRAAVEGVCQQLALVRESVTAAGHTVTEVRATGGAVASELWVRVLADALDLPVTVADTPEGTGLGACLLGWHALGDLPDLDRAAGMVDLGQRTQPDPEAAARYARLRPLIERSVAATMDVLTELDRLAPEPLPGTEKAVPRESR